MRLDSARLRVSFVNFCQHMISQPMCASRSPLQHALNQLELKKQHAFHTSSALAVVSACPRF